MQDAFDQLLDKGRALWQRRFLILFIAWPLCIGGWLYVASMPDQYEARARIYINTETLLKPLLEGLTVETDVDTQVRLLFKNILSRSNLEKIARVSDLDLTVSDQEAFDQLVLGLEKEIRANKLDREQNLYSLSYQNTDPNLARKVVETTINVFMEDLLGGNRVESQTVQSFLQDQINVYEKRLLAEDRKLADFKREHAGLLPGDAGNYYAHLESEKRNLEQAQLALREQEGQLQAARAKLDDFERKLSNSVTQPAGVTTSVDERITNLEQHLDSLQLRYTDLHPKVVEAKRLLEQLQKQRDEELQALASESSAGQASEGSYIQELRLLVAQQEGNVASMRIRVDTYQKRVDELESLISKVPEIEAELVALRRGYEITRKKYEELLSRRETATLGQRADEQADSLKFRVIDQAKVGSEPVGPKRLRLIALVFFASCAVAMAVPYLLNEVNPRVYNLKHLAYVSGVPVFGEVTDGRIREGVTIAERMKDVGFAAGVILLVGLFSMLLTLQVMADSALAQQLRSLEGKMW